MELTDNLLRLRSIFEETMEAEESMDIRRLAELDFEEEAIRNALTPSELHSHMLYLIQTASGTDPEAIIDNVEKQCGSRRPEDQNIFIENILLTLSEEIEQENAASGYMSLLSEGPKGVQ